MQFPFAIMTFTSSPIMIRPEAQETRMAQMQGCQEEEALFDKKLLVYIYISGTSLTCTGFALAVSSLSLSLSVSVSVSLSLSLSLSLCLSLCLSLSLSLSLSLVLFCAYLCECNTRIRHTCDIGCQYISVQIRQGAVQVWHCEILQFHFRDPDRVVITQTGSSNIPVTECR